MRRFGCVPTLIIITLSGAVLALAGSLLTNSAISLMGWATAAISQIVTLIVLVAVALISVGAIALRDPMLRAIVARRAGVTMPVPPPAAHSQMIEPPVQQIAPAAPLARRIETTGPVLRQRVRSKPLGGGWGFGGDK